MLWEIIYYVEFVIDCLLPQICSYKVLKSDKYKAALCSFAKNYKHFLIICFVNLEVKSLK